MKKIATSLSIILLGLSNLLNAQIVNIPDNAFLTVLLGKYDTNKNGSIEITEINTVTDLDVSNSGISSLGGIENFTSLINLNCSKNTLSSVSIQALTNLKTLNCSNNNLQALDVTNNLNLNYLDATSNNKLTTICVNSKHITETWKKDILASFSTKCAANCPFVNIPTINDTKVSLCEGDDSKSFNITPAKNHSLLWYDQDGALILEFSLNYNTVGTTVYQVSQDSAGCESAKTLVTWTVNSIKNIEGLSTNVLQYTSDNDIFGLTLTNYTWTFDKPSVSSTPSAMDAGFFKGTYISNDGCSNTATWELLVNPQEVVTQTCKVDNVFLNLPGTLLPTGEIFQNYASATTDNGCPFDGNYTFSVDENDKDIIDIDPSNGSFVGRSEGTATIYVTANSMTQGTASNAIQVSFYNPTPQLIGDYSFCGTASPAGSPIDSNNYNLTTDRYAQAYASGMFYGNNNLLVPNNAADNFSVSFWMQVPKQDNSGKRFAQYTSLVDAGVDDVANDWGILLNGDVVQFNVGDNINKEWVVVSPKTVVSDNAWHHVVATRQIVGPNSSYIKLYIDGALSGVNTANTIATLNDSKQIGIGLNPAFEGFGFTGKLDDIKIYNGVLQEEDVRALNNEKSECNIQIPDISLISVKPTSASIAWGNVPIDEMFIGGESYTTVQYQLEVATDESFNNIAFSKSNIYNNNYEVTGLQPSTTYHARIKAFDGSAYTPFVYLQFNTSKPSTIKPIEVTGFNQDVVMDPYHLIQNRDDIANNPNEIGKSVTQYADPQSSFTFYANTIPAAVGGLNNYTLPGGFVSDTVKSASNAGVVYKLQDFNKNNVLFLDGSTSNGTLNISNPTSYSQLSFLATSCSGDNGSDAMVELLFADNSISTYNLNVSDWFGGQNIAMRGMGRVEIKEYKVEADGTEPRLYDHVINLSEADKNKILVGVRFTKTDIGDNSSLNIFALSGEEYISPMSNVLTFDGESQMITVNNAKMPLGNAPYTLQARIKTNTKGRLGIIGYGTYYRKDSVNALRLTEDGGLLNYWWDNDLIITGEQLNTKGLSLTDNKWHEVTATYNGLTRSLYVDGQLVAQDTSSKLNIVENFNLTIGETEPSFPELFNGSIDEVRVWNRALCQGEIQNNMNAEIPADATGLLVNYHFNQKTGVIATDNSGNNNDGNLVGYCVDVQVCAPFSYDADALNSGSNANGFSKPVNPDVVTPVVQCQFDAAKTLLATGSNLVWYTDTLLQGNTTAPIIDTKIANNYTVYVSNVENNCESAKMPIIVRINPAPTVTALASDSALCLGSTVLISTYVEKEIVWARMAESTVKFSWNTGATEDFTDNPIKTTTYSVLAYDINTNCTASDSVTVKVLNLPEIDIVASDSVICFNDSVLFTVDTPFSLSWDNELVNNGVYFKPSISDTYIAKVTDTLGCSALDTVQVKVNNLPEVLANASDYSPCQGDMVSLTGFGAITYKWSNGVSDGLSFKVDSITDYTVTGTDANGCSGISFVSLEINKLPKISLSTSNTQICIGDSVQITAKGASDYVWNSGNTSNILDDLPLTTTTFSVNGTDENGCKGQDSITINVNLLPTFSIMSSDTAICIGDNVLLNIVSTDSVSWNNSIINNTPFSPTLTQFYTATVFDKIGCFSQDSIKIKVDTLPIVKAEASKTLLCENDLLTLSGTGALSYTWNKGVTNNISFTADTTQNFTVIGTDANGCIGTDSITVSVNSAPQISISALKKDICFGDTAQLTAFTPNQGVVFEWQDGSKTSLITESILTDKKYLLKGTDLIGCIGYDSLQITVHTPPTFTITSSDSAICFGEYTKLEVTTTDSVSWNKSIINNTPFSPTLTQYYTATVFDKIGCFSQDSIKIKVDTLPIVKAQASKTLLCENDLLTLYGTGALSYTWNKGITDNISFTADTTQNFTVIGTDVNGCIGTDSIKVSVNSAPQISISALKKDICFGDTAQLTAFTPNQGVVFEWQDGSKTSQIAEPILIDKKYLLKGTDLIGCIGYDSLQITVHTPPTFTITSSDSAICFGEFTKLEVTTKDSLIWNKGIINNTPFSPTLTQYYTATVFDKIGCFSQDSIKIKVDTLPIVKAQASKTLLCENDLLTLYGTGALSYTWNKGITDNISFTADTTQYFTVIGTDVNGCIGIDSVSVSVNSAPKISITVSNKQLCENDTVIITATGALNYIWTNGIENNKPFIITNKSTYTVLATDFNNCSATDSILLNPNTLPIINGTPQVEKFCNTAIGSAIQPQIVLNFSEKVVWYGKSIPNSKPTIPIMTADLSLIGKTSYYFAVRDSITTCISKPGVMDVEVYSLPNNLVLSEPTIIDSTHVSSNFTYDNTSNTYMQLTGSNWNVPTKTGSILGTTIANYIPSNGYSGLTPARYNVVAEACTSNWSPVTRLEVKAKVSFATDSIYKIQKGDTLQIPIQIIGTAPFTITYNGGKTISIADTLSQTIEFFDAGIYSFDYVMDSSGVKTMLNNKFKLQLDSLAQITHFTKSPKCKGGQGKFVIKATQIPGPVKFEVSSLSANVIDTPIQIVDSIATFKLDAGKYVANITDALGYDYTSVQFDVIDSALTIIPALLVKSDTNRVYASDKSFQIEAQNVATNNSVIWYTSGNISIKDSVIKPMVLLTTDSISDFVSMKALVLTNEGCLSDTSNNLIIYIYPNITIPNTTPEIVAGDSLTVNLDGSMPFEVVYDVNGKVDTVSNINQRSLKIITAKQGYIKVISIKDAAGIISRTTADTVIVIPNVVTIDSVFTTNALCKGKMGKVHINANGKAPITYSIFSKDSLTGTSFTTNADTLLLAGTYNVQAKDGDGVVSSVKQFTVSENQFSSLVIPQIIDPTFTYLTIDDSIINLQIKKPVNGAIAYSWTVSKSNVGYFNSDSTTSNVFKLSPDFSGKFSLGVTAVDSFGCATDTSLVIPFQRTGTAVLTYIGKNKLYYDETGTVQLIVKGTAPFIINYILDGNKLTKVSNSDTTSFSIGGGKTISIQKIIDDDSLNISWNGANTFSTTLDTVIASGTTSTFPKCKGVKADVTVTVSNGKAPYKLLFTEQNTLITDTVTLVNSGAKVQIFPGNYTYTIIDAAGFKNVSQSSWKVNIDTASVGYLSYMPTVSINNVLPSELYNNNDLYKAMAQTLLNVSKFTWDINPKNAIVTSLDSTQSNTLVWNENYSGTVSLKAKGWFDGCPTGTTVLQFILKPYIQYKIIANKEVEITARGSKPFALTYNINGQTVVADNIKSTMRIPFESAEQLALIKIIDSSGNVTLFNNLTIEKQYIVAEFYEGFSPNGDGVNDLYRVRNYEFDVRKAKFEVYDFNGILVYQNDNFKGTWDGKNNAGENLNSGNYYFIFTDYKNNNTSSTIETEVQNVNHTPDYILPKVSQPRGFIELRAND